MTLSEEFLAKGIVKIPVEDKKSLDSLRDVMGIENDIFIIKPENLNDYRIHKIGLINKTPFLKKKYFSIAKNTLHELVGNELVMQRNINLSIQLPNDDSSLLPVHCDTWSGDSPYEVVLWVPLVDCYGTKSMFFCDKTKDAEIQPLMAKYKNSEDLFKAIEPHVTFMNVRYGEALIFTQNIMHGNRVNTTNEARWSLNCRFKSLFSPYADKKLGEFFEPIKVRPATMLGMNYQLPTIRSVYE